MTTRLSEIAHVADTIPRSQIVERVTLEARRLSRAAASDDRDDQLFATVMLMVLAARQLREVLEVQLSEAP